jgi:thioesterase domain-containing protein
MEIVCLQNGNIGKPLYCLPTAAGSVGPYLALAQALGPDCLVYGIQCADTDRNQSGDFLKFQSLPEMAATIAAELRAQHRDDGPIGLVGYSFAAFLAIELAQQLIKDGKLVPLVVIIDKVPTWASFAPLFRVWHCAKHIWPWALRLATRIATDSRYRSSYRNALARESKRQHRFESESWFKRLPENHRNYVANNLNNSRNYRFSGKYSGKILVIRSGPNAKSHFASYLLAQIEDYGWGRITGASVNVVYIDSDHSSMMEHPDVVHVASALRSALK